MSLNDFFARKKGKKVAKPMNLNADGTEVAAEEKKPDSKDAKEWKQEEEEEKPAISPSSKTITQLQSTEETEKEAKTWNAKKASAEAQPTAGGRYMTPFNAPGYYYWEGAERLHWDWGCPCGTSISDVGGEFSDKKK